jgi:hypothetical protein
MQVRMDSLAKATGESIDNVTCAESRCDAVVAVYESAMLNTLQHELEITVPIRFQSGREIPAPRDASGGSALWCTPSGYHGDTIGHCPGPEFPPSLNAGGGIARNLHAPNTAVARRRHHRTPAGGPSS